MTVNRRIGILASVVLLLLAVLATGCGGESESGGKTSMQDVQKEAGEAAEAMKQYAGQQKEAFVDEAETALEKLDAQIQAYKQSIEDKWDEMDRKAREQAEKTLDTLKEKRAALAEKLNEAKDRSVEAWEKMRKEFWNSYESLKKSLEQDQQEVKYI